MSLRFIVLDKNELRINRANEVIQLLKSSPETNFVLSDVSFIEMTKNSNDRKKSVKQALKMLAPYLERVHVARAISSIINDEFLEYSVEATNILYPEATEFVRKILDNLNKNIIGPELEKIHSDPEGHHQDIANDHFNHAFNKKSVAGLIESLRNDISEDFAKELRANRVSREARLAAIHLNATGLLSQHLQTTFNLSFEKTWDFISKRPMMLKYYYSRIWLCIDWLRRGGFECIAEKKVSNDLMDHDYIMTATCFNGLISGDKRVIGAYNDISELLSRKIIPS